MSRGRGRGRSSRGGPRGAGELLGDTMEELGLNRYDNDINPSNVLFPPIELPNPSALTDADYYMVQKYRELLSHWNQMYVEDATETIHITSMDLPPGETGFYIPMELKNSNITHTQPVALSKEALPKSGYLPPKAFEKTLKQLENKETKQGTALEAETSGIFDEQESMDDDLGDEANDYNVDHYDSEVETDDGNDLGDDVYYG